MARILVIEDDTASLELMAYLLTAFGHEAIVAGDGEAGLLRARTEPPDLILCDVQMPKLDGYGVVAQLKADPQLRLTPCIAVTAFAMVGDRDRILAAGFDGYITKPITPDTFVALAETFLPTDRTSGPEHMDLSSPVGRAQLPAESMNEGRSASPRHASILIVDNSPENIEFLRSLFEYSGYTVTTVGTIEQALHHARQHPLDLILCDLHLQGESGLDFLRLVRTDPALHHLPFIVTSSSTWDRKDQLEALALGASKFILRPIDPATLLAEVNGCLR